MLSKCSAFFEETMILVRGSQKLANLTGGIESTDTEKNRWIDKLFTNIMNAEVISDLAMIKSAKENRTLIEASLCGKLLRLAKPPLIKDMIGLIDHLKSKSDEMLGHYSAYNAYLKTLKLASSKSRSMQSLAQLFVNSVSMASEIKANLFVGDVTVLPQQDSLYYSVYGISGTQANIFMKEPMNLTLTFP